MSQVTSLSTEDIKNVFAYVGNLLEHKEQETEHLLEVIEQLETRIEQLEYDHTDEDEQ